jgi:hypothetical protein
MSALMVQCAMTAATLRRKFTILTVDVGIYSGAYIIEGSDAFSSDRVYRRSGSTANGELTDRSTEIFLRIGICASISFLCR